MHYEQVILEDISVYDKLIQYRNFLGSRYDVYLYLRKDEFSNLRMSSKRAYFKEVSNALLVV